MNQINNADADSNYKELPSNGGVPPAAAGADTEKEQEETQIIQQDDIVNDDNGAPHFAQPYPSANEESKNINITADATSPNINGNSAGEDDPLPPYVNA